MTDFYLKRASELKGGGSNGKRAERDMAQTVRPLYLECIIPASCSSSVVVADLCKTIIEYSRIHLFMTPLLNTVTISRLSHNERIALQLTAKPDMF